MFSPESEDAVGWGVGGWGLPLGGVWAVMFQNQQLSELFLIPKKNEGNVQAQLTVLKQNINHQSSVMSLYDIICSLKAICQSCETERRWYLTTRNNVPFNSNVWLTREKDIRYGTSLKNSTDNLHTAMALNKCQTLSAVCSEELLHPVRPNASEELQEINLEVVRYNLPKDKILIFCFVFIH